MTFYELKPGEPESNNFKVFDAINRVIMDGKFRLFNL